MPDRVALLRVLLAVAGLTALALLAFVLAISLLIWAVFAIVDARAAFDGDPKTWTASGRIKQWRRKAWWRTALLSLILAALAMIPVTLFFHLVLEAF